STIRPGDPVPNITFMLAGRSPSLVRLRQRFAASPFWINNAPRYNESIDGFGSEPPSREGAPDGTWHRMGPAAIEVRPNERIPEDDWPFLYLRDPLIPAVNLRGIALMAALSVGLLFAISPGRGMRMNWRMFFMGAGFMLLETKSIVQLALLFGSTWLVNAVVVSAILVMVLASNLFVLAFRPDRAWPFYVLLAAAIGVGVVVPMKVWLDVPGTMRLAVACGVVFLPIVFGGVVFSLAFRDSAAPDLDFGSNIAGAAIGGLAEALSLVI